MRAQRVIASKMFGTNLRLRGLNLKHLIAFTGRGILTDSRVNGSAGYVYDRRFAKRRQYLCNLANL